jgi:hypothetical protein
VMNIVFNLEDFIAVIFLIPEKAIDGRMFGLLK